MGCSCGSRMCLLRFLGKVLPCPVCVMRNPGGFRTRVLLLEAVYDRIAGA